VKERIIWRDRVGGRKEEERNLAKKKIKRVITGLRDGKALGVDVISNKVWKYGGGACKRDGKYVIGYGRGRDSQKNEEEGRDSSTNTKKESKRQRTEELRRCRRCIKFIRRL